MSIEAVVCTLCGHRYSPAPSAGCNSCPVGSGCGTMCCPACGYSTIDVSRSRLVRLFRFFRRPATVNRSAHATLADVHPGGQVFIAGFSTELSHPQREHLQAYGLAEGCSVRVLQHSPATVIRVDHLELALEPDLARLVRIRRDAGTGD